MTPCLSVVSSTPGKSRFLKGFPSSSSDILLLLLVSALSFSSDFYNIKSDYFSDCLHLPLLHVRKV